MWVSYLTKELWKDQPNLSRILPILKGKIGFEGNIITVTREVNRRARVIYGRRRATRSHAG
jgi:hypothetical protein